MVVVLSARDSLMFQTGFMVWLVLMTCAFAQQQQQKLRFGENGEFKILQVADMHYVYGKTTPCRDVLPSQLGDCSDLNTTAFLRRMIRAEEPDLIIFTGDNIYGSETKDPNKSMDEAFAPAIESNIPWAAVLGNHDQESSLTREGLMKYIVTLNNTLSQVNPPLDGAQEIDGFGNYNLEIKGAKGSSFQNKSVLNLYMLDSGDYFFLKLFYAWIKDSQKSWFRKKSEELKKAYMEEPEPQKGPAPGLVYFHIPFPEFKSFGPSNITGDKQEGIASPIYNSGFFETMVEAGDVKGVMIGHDHINDFCGELSEIQLCYGGGFGYHAYGKAGWSRRARVVVASLDKRVDGTWGDVKSVKTWKRLDDETLSTKDAQTLWSK